MQMRTGVLIGLAVVLAGVTFFLAKMWLDSTKQGIQARSKATTKQEQVQTAEILVAKTNLPAGTRLKREHLEWRVWPKKGVVKTHFVKNDKKMEDVLDQIVRHGILAGQPLVAGRIVEQGDRGYMAALLEPGMQAVSIKVRKETSVAGFIKPGDRVNVLLTITFKSKSKIKPKVTETVLEDVLVIATDQVTDDQSTKPSIAKLITMQVTPKEAQLFTMGASVGRISLVLPGLAGERYTAVASADTAEKSETKEDAGAGRDSAANDSDTSAGDDSDLDPLDAVTPFRTWHSETSGTIPQMNAGTGEEFNEFQIVRGNRSETAILPDGKKKKKKKKKKEEDSETEVVRGSRSESVKISQGKAKAQGLGKKSKNVSKKTATGFQAGTRAAGTSVTVLR